MLGSSGNIKTSQKCTISCIRVIFGECQTLRHRDKSAPGHFGTCARHFGTKTNRHQDKSAPGQIGTSKRQIGTCVFFFDFTSFDCYRMYFTSLFSFLKSCFDLSDKFITLSCQFYGLVSIIQDYVGWVSLYMY